MAEARGDNGGSSKLSPSPKEQGLTSMLLLTALQSDGPTGQALIRGVVCLCQ
jgi:hypothetical protein